MDETKRIRAERLEAWSVNLLQAVGAPADEAVEVARYLVCANLGVYIKVRHNVRRSGLVQTIQAIRVR